MIRVTGTEPIFVDVDRRLGEVIVRDHRIEHDLCFSAVQSQNLRAVLQRAELVIETGVGDMDEPSSTYGERIEGGDPEIVVEIDEREVRIAARAEELHAAHQLGQALGAAFMLTDAHEEEEAQARYRDLVAGAV